MYSCLADCDAYTSTNLPKLANDFDLATYKETEPSQFYQNNKHNITKPTY